MARGFSIVEARAYHGRSCGDRLYFFVAVNENALSTYDLPASRTLRVSNAGIFTFGEEAIVIDEDRPSIGRAVCVVSGRRFAFRRVLAVHGRTLVLRADVAPFEDRWDGEVVGCVVPRMVDRAAAISPERWTKAGWHASVAYAHALARARRIRRPKRVRFRTETIEDERWPDVRAFWYRACGRELPLHAQRRQHVIGLFDRDALVGANIVLALGKTAFSAFTLVDRRYRGMGGGNAMLTHAIREAQKREFESMYVHIHARNLPSIAAYERAGFARRGWWTDPSDPLASAERQWLVFERDFRAC
jgi:ribosomal protein S18 acetylase RimI-like enzyme